jgi:membrane protein
VHDISAGGAGTYGEVCREDYGRGGSDAAPAGELYLTAMKAEALWNLLKATLHEWLNDDNFRFAAALAFYTIFSLAPLVLIAAGIVGLLFGPDTATEHLVEEAGKLVGPQGGNVVRQAVEGAKGVGRNPTAIAVGLVTLFIGSTAVFASLQSALNQVWDIEVRPERSTLKNLLQVRLRSFVLALGVGFLLLLSLMFSAVLSAARELVGGGLLAMPLLWESADLVLSFLLITVLFAAIYKYLPDVRIAWKDVWIGAVVTAGLFSVGKALIGIYLGRFAVRSAYGAAGSLVVLLFWVYYSALICFFGAEFTQVYARRFGSEIRPNRHAVRAGRKRDES